MHLQYVMQQPLYFDVVMLKHVGVAIVSHIASAFSLYLNENSDSKWNK
jgi:hypothetical protein